MKNSLELHYTIITWLKFHGHFLRYLINHSLDESNLTPEQYKRSLVMLAWASFDTSYYPRISPYWIDHKYRAEGKVTGLIISIKPREKRDCKGFVRRYDRWQSKHICVDAFVRNKYATVIVLHRSMHRDGSVSFGVPAVGLSGLLAIHTFLQHRLILQST